MSEYLHSPHCLHVLDGDSILYNPLLDASFAQTVFESLWMLLAQSAFICRTSLCVGYHSSSMFIRPQFWVFHISCTIDWDVSLVYSVFPDRCYDSMLEQAVGFLLIFWGENIKRKPGQMWRKVMNMSTFVLLFGFI